MILTRGVAEERAISIQRAVVNRTVSNMEGAS